MPLSRSQSRLELEALQLPAAVLSIFDGAPLHPALAYRCQDPHYVFSVPDLEKGHLTPLWECGVLVTAFQHRDSDSHFIRFSLETPTDVTVLGLTFQSVVADLLIDLWENDLQDASMAEIAALLEFHHLERLLEECENRPPSEALHHYLAWRSGFLASCEGER